MYSELRYFPFNFMILSVSVENLSYKKPIWVNSFRPTHKKRRHASQAAWSRANSGFAAVGQRDVTVHVDDVSGLADSCVTLNNHHVEQPTMRIDLGRRSLIAGVFVAAVTSSTVRVPRKTGYFNGLFVVYSMNSIGICVLSAVRRAVYLRGL